VIEFINIPIFVIKFLLDVVEALFGHIGDVCSYLDGYVQLAKVEATYENTRYVLHELACRAPADIALQRGYGCDGLDNTCDADKQIDECDEDIFPPEIDATMAFLECGDKIFANHAKAQACVAEHTSAVDDCKPIVIKTASSSACVSTVTLTATAQGCGGRTEDTASVTIPVQIDGGPQLSAAPLVSKTSEAAILITRTLPFLIKSRMTIFPSLTSLLKSSAMKWRRRSRRWSLSQPICRFLLYMLETGPVTPLIVAAKYPTLSILIVMDVIPVHPVLAHTIISGTRSAIP
jgi:hypothetical protein